MLKGLIMRKKLIDVKHMPTEAFASRMQTIESFNTINTLPPIQAKSKMVMMPIKNRYTGFDIFSTGNLNTRDIKIQRSNIDHPPPKKSRNKVSQSIQVNPTA
jgi:hypothetical protein